MRSVRTAGGQLAVGAPDGPGMAAQARRHLTLRAIAWFDRLSGAIMLGFAGYFVVELVHLVSG
ncbi:hypothetical protein [Micromonospora sp. LOL_023]|uniref:hypothetical protein n=1 Tax=Micromonospora sp. LOL_023 TaxID=3345418 RepID=UPI003A893D8D